MSKGGNRVEKWQFILTFASISKTQASQLKKITRQTLQNTHTHMHWPLATIQEEM